MNRIENPLSIKRKRICLGAQAMRGSSSSSLARVRQFLSICALPALSLCVALMVQPAHAATWPLPTSELSATLAFHQSYTAGIESYVHSGIDIPASAGMQISSPLAGTVRFTGAVPSGDSRTGGTSSGKTMIAVSIELDDNHVITLMPFATVSVHEGQVVDEGTSLGTLAASGDVSTAATHLHMGYKQGSSYLDPMQLFSAALTAPAGAASKQASELPATIMGVPMSGMAPEATHPGLVEESPTLQEQFDAASASQGAPETGIESFGSIETGSYKLAQHEAQASVVNPVTGVIGWLVDACIRQFTALRESLADLSHGTGIPLPALTAFAYVLPLGMVAVMCFACARCFGPRMRDALLSQKGRLSLVVGGDSMHKLFPASGAAFMSRSRIAQRR